MGHIFSLVISERYFKQSKEINFFMIYKSCWQYTMKLFLEPTGTAKECGGDHGAGWNIFWSFERTTLLPADSSHKL